MHEVDLLGAYLPEFGELTCLVQHEFFHRYSADEHTLVCIEKLDALLEPDEHEIRRLPAALRESRRSVRAVSRAAAARYRQGDERAPSRGGERAVRAKGRGPAAAILRTAAFADPAGRPSHDAVVHRPAAQPGRPGDDRGIRRHREGPRQPRRADAPDARRRPRHERRRVERLEGIARLAALPRHRQIPRRRRGGISSPSASSARASARPSPPRWTPSYAEEIDAHFHWMPERYFETFDAAAIAEHLRLIRQFLAYRQEHDSPRAALAPAIRWKPQPERGHTECWVCTWERKGLFAKIAGSFAAVRPEHPERRHLHARRQHRVGHFPGLRSLATCGDGTARFRRRRRASCGRRSAGAVRFRAVAPEGAPPAAAAARRMQERRFSHPHGHHQRGDEPLHPAGSADAGPARPAVRPAARPGQVAGSTSSSRASPPRKARPSTVFM